MTPRSQLQQAGQAHLSSCFSWERDLDLDFVRPTADRHYQQTGRDGTACGLYLGGDLFEPRTGNWLSVLSVFAALSGRLDNHRDST